MKITTKEARETKIFIINEENEVEETNLLDFVMESAEKTTSPRGVEMKLHVRKNKANDEEHNVHVWTWGNHGNNPKPIKEFDTEKEAEDFIFQLTHDYDFMPDDQRDTAYYETREDAELDIIERER